MAVTKKTTKKTATKKSARGAKSSATTARAASRPTAKSTAAKKTTAKKTAAPKKTATVKLNDRQREYLQRIKAAGETGYEAGPSYEQRTIDALVERKLVKRGAKDKTSGKHRFMLTKSGEKHATSGPAPATTS